MDDLNITFLEFGDQIYDKKHSGMDGSFFKTWDHLSGSVTCRKKKEKESRQMVGDLLRRDQFARSFNLPLSEPLAAKTWGPLPTSTAAPKSRLKGKVDNL